MASKLKKAAAAKPAPSTGQAAAAAGESALDVLHPDAVLPIAGRLVEVREYGYIEGLKLQVGAKGFLDALYALVKRDTEAPPSHLEVSELFAEFAVTIQWMVAQAITPVTDIDSPEVFVDAVRANAAWIAKLSDDQGDLLTSAWYEVNKRFFTRRVQRRALAEKEKAARASS